MPRKVRGKGFYKPTKHSSAGETVVSTTAQPKEDIIEVPRGSNKPIDVSNDDVDNVVVDDDSFDEHDASVIESQLSLSKTNLGLDLCWSQRVAVADQFVRVHGAPKKELWKQLKLCTTIKNTLTIPRGTKIKYIFEEVLLCKSLGLKYDGRSKRTNSGRKSIIKLESVNSQIIASSISDGCSVQTTADIVNHHRIAAQLPLLTLSAVWYHVKKMNPILVPIAATQQGSLDPHSAWARARLNIVAQLTIRFGNQLPIVYPQPKHPPPQFDPDKLPPLPVNSVVWWDEVHEKCNIGALVTKTKAYRLAFRVNKQGQFDPKGKYDRTPKTKLNVKFDGETRMGLGCAAVEYENGTVEAKVCTIFNYSEKTIVSIKDWNDKLQLEFNRVRKLTGGGWVIDNRPIGAIYRNDAVSKLKGLGTAKQQLLNQHGIQTMSDIANLSEEKMSELQRVKNGKQVRQWHQTVRLMCIDSDAPELLDHRKASNPYKSRYGDNWRDKVKSVVTMSHFVCVTELIDHIFTESERIMRGTKYELTWSVYHDALSLMTAKDSIEYMKEKNWYHHWVLPLNGLQDNQGLNRYRDRPVGNMPEAMPWDMSLNRDLHSIVRRHVAETSMLPKDDPNKFSLATPTKAFRAYNRCLDLLPPHQILHDIYQVPKSMLTIYHHGGVVVQGLATRAGNRFVSFNKHVDENNKTTSSNWGGKRKRNDDMKEHHKIHADAMQARESKIKLANELWKASHALDTCLSK